MAKHLDLEEQEQLDQIKHFWARYGNLITWVLIAVFGSMAAWNGWQYWQRNQAVKSAALYDEIDRAVLARDVEAVERSLADMKNSFSGTTFADQGALLAAKSLSEAGKEEGARAALGWVRDESSDPAYQAIARLRLAGMDVAAKNYDAALQTLTAEVPPSFQALVADRRGDVLMAQGKNEEAKAEYQTAWRSFGPRDEYKRLVEVKLASLGVDVATLAPATEVAR